MTQSYPHFKAAACHAPPVFLDSAKTTAKACGTPFYMLGLGMPMPYSYASLVLLALGGVCLIIGVFAGQETKDVDFHGRNVPGIVAKPPSRRDGVLHHSKVRSLRTGLGQSR